MIYPSTFPLGHDNPYEQEVYHAMQRAFGASEDFDVYYARKFSGVTKGEKVDYEIDFLIADIRNDKFKGLCILEVKGNQILFRADSGNWIQDGRVMDDSPTSQARSNMNSLLKRYSSLARNVVFGWAVCFPKMVNPGAAHLPTELSDHQYFDELCLSYMEEKVQAFFKTLYESYESRGARPSEYALLKETLLRNLGITMSLGTQIEQTNHRFFQMTEKQMELLRLFSANNDVLVRGVAGSGKTLMALTIAKEKAEQGLNVLFLCYNRALANHLRYRVDRDLENLQVTTYHSLARQIIEEFDPGWWRTHVKEEDFWTLLIAIKLLDVPEDALPKYDAIIIDEAQDLRDEWYETIEGMTHEDSSFYVFLDNDQDIFGAKTTIPLKRKMFEFELKTNCRNTVRIIDTLKEYIEGNIQVMEGAVEGAPVQVLEYANDTEQMNLIKNEWLRLVEEEEVRPDQILIMMNATRKESCLANVKKFGRFSIESMGKGRLSRKAVNYASINTFKGLEVPIMFLIDTDKPKEPSEKVLYTQVSRATQKVYMLIRNA